MEKFICCICGKECNEWGNNPDGAVWKDEQGKIVFGKFDRNDKCCKECDNRYVIPGRMYQIALEQQKGEV